MILLNHSTYIAYGIASLRCRVIALRGSVGVEERGGDGLVETLEVGVALEDCFVDGR